MAGVRDEFLARAGLAEDQQRHVHCRHPSRSCLEGTHRGRIAQNALEPVPQGVQPFPDTGGSVEHDHPARALGEWTDIEQERMAAQQHLPGRQVEAAGRQLLVQTRIVQDFAQPNAGQLHLADAGHGRGGRVGDHDVTTAVNRNDRIGHRVEQRVEMQATPLTWQHVYGLDRANILHGE
jgi:hypothetical protein